MQRAVLPDFTFAFQPIVDAQAHEIYSYEALLRGRDQSDAATLLEQVTGAELYILDQRARVGAIELATRLGLDCRLNLNGCARGFSRSSTSMRSTLEAAELNGLAHERIILEIAEDDLMNDAARVAPLLSEYRSAGVRLAIDDFGAGHAGLNLLAEFRPDYVKLDMTLVRAVESRERSQAVVRGILRTCADLAVDVIAEGVETKAEKEWLEGAGVRLFQGYLFAKPAFEKLVVAEALRACQPRLRRTRSPRPETVAVY